jgi:hypothetical protein
LLEVELGRPSEPNAKDQATSGKMIKGDRLAGDLPWTSAGDRGNDGAKSEGVRPGSYSRECNPRVDNFNRRIRIKGNMVPQEESVPPSIFGINS